MALTAQGFAKARPASPARHHLLQTIQQLSVIQIDSVNVVSRTHYLPLFSRLGAYPRAALEDMAWGSNPDLFEYWMHEASLAPWSLQPLMRWRMEDAQSGVGVWKGVAAFLKSHPDFIARVHDQITERGPLTAAELEVGGAKGAKGWWGWSQAKRATECLFWTGQLTAATRRSTFERVYDLPQNVHIPAVLKAPTPTRDEAQRDLIRLAARAQGVATERDLRDYFRMGPKDTRARIAELADLGELIPVTVEGWTLPAWRHAETPLPRKITATALLSPFDNLIWFRERTERLFGVRVRLEIYTPAHKRVHGYYVLPFLQGEALTARVDLKAERKAATLRVQAAHAEPWADEVTAPLLARELTLMAGWLGLERVEVEPRGDLAGALSAALAAALGTGAA
jgi:uncharacterized protein YcaQ